LKLKNKEGASEYWFSMQVVNANEGVAKLEVSTDNGESWVGTTRKYYNFFEREDGFESGEVDVRVTGVSGKIVVVRGVDVASGKEVVAGGNL
jgi:expansin (peptidoglycan-binding protein)